MSRPHYRMFVDDTGNVDRVTDNIRKLRFGGVAGAVLRMDYVVEVFDPAFNAMCERHFGLTPDGKPYSLHRRALVRPSSNGPYACLLDEDKRNAFDANCVRMYEQTEYHVIAAVVDKVAFYYRYPNWDGDFYHVLIEALIERFIYFLRANDATGDIFIEAKGGGERDHKLKDAYRRSFENGFRFLPAALVQNHLSSAELNIADKKKRIPGLQFADLIAAPALAQCLYVYFDAKSRPAGLHGQVAEILETKKFYRRKSGNPHGYGRVWRPQPK